MNNFRAIAMLSSLLICSLGGIGHAQKAGFSEETKSPDSKTKETGAVTSKNTSREKTYGWNPITIPSGAGFSFSQRVSNLSVSIIEQKSGDGRINTLYAASGTLFNASEDDKTHHQTQWTIRFTNAAGTVIDTFVFNLPWDHCSYHGEEPFSIPPTPSAFNFFDVIVSATAQGFKPGGYEGGC